MLGNLLFFFIKWTTTNKKTRIGTIAHGKKYGTGNNISGWKIWSDYLKSNTLTSKIHICRRQTLNFERAQVDDWQFCSPSTSKSFECLIFFLIVVHIFLGQRCIFLWQCNMLKKISFSPILIRLSSIPTLQY